MPPILISLSRRLVSDQCRTASGRARVNKPSDAALGGDEVAVAVTPSDMAFHVVGTKVRTCVNRSERNVHDQIVKWGKPFCSPWN